MHTLTYNHIYISYTHVDAYIQCFNVIVDPSGPIGKSQTLIAPGPPAPPVPATAPPLPTAPPALPAPSAPSAPSAPPASSSPGPCDMTRHNKLPCKLHLMSTEINWDPQKSQIDIKRLYSLCFSRLSTWCNSLWQVEDVKRHIYVLWFTLCDFSSELDAILCRPWCDPCKVFHTFSRTWEWLGWQGPVIYFPHKLCLQRCTSVIEPC